MRVTSLTSAGASGSDEPGFISRDRCRLYFHRFGPDANLMLAKRTPK